MADKIELKQKALSLPREPGVYIMKNIDKDVIYVGKAKSLRNRVSQYFQSEDRHTSKTQKMIANIFEFDIIVTQTEFEALVLESSLIKKYQPKYNILLKDDKGYPYIKVTTSKEFPIFSVVSKPQKDADRYFGPYTSRGAANKAIDTINDVLKLKTCQRVFPRDIGKERACLNYHLKKCIAPCTGNISSEEYRELINEAINLLQGDFKGIANSLETKMLEASEALQFERAAVFRDRLNAVNKMGQQQKVVASGFADMDIIAFVQGHTKGCVVVLHYLIGNLHEKEYTIIDGTNEEDGAEILSTFIKQYYSLRNVVPKVVLLSEDIEEIDAVADFLSSISNRKVELAVPQRGKRLDIIKLAKKNAEEEVARIETNSERRIKSLELFRDMTGMEETPTIFEAYDISNLSGTSTVGSMVVFENAQPAKKKYRRFKIDSVADGQDDYKAMEEMLTRRVQRFIDGDEKFTPLPSAFLIDGGLGHVKIAKRVLDKFSLTTPVFGMVKDDHHRTRGLVSLDGREFGISTIPALFSMVGRIQEEVHRFAIEYHRTLRTKKSHGSTLDKIEGVGEKRRSELLKHFKSITNIKNATLEELCKVVPRDVAQRIVIYFEKENKNESN